MMDRPAMPLDKETACHTCVHKYWVNSSMPVKAS